MTLLDKIYTCKSITKTEAILEAADGGILDIEDDALVSFVPEVKYHVVISGNILGGNYKISIKEMV